MFKDFDYDSLLIFISLILSCIVLFMIYKKTKAKYYIIGFLLLFISLAIYVYVSDPHGRIWERRIAHYVGLDRLTGSHHKGNYVINRDIENGIYKSSIELANNNVWVYDPSYYRIEYPNGDVPSGGACTDVVIRVLRENNLDLQQLIHDDMENNFSDYPNKWGMSKTDANIDHRRVPNIMKYFERQGWSMPITQEASDYKPGDIVTWELSRGTTHIGIVLENQDVFHNMGPTSRVESGFLFSHRIIGHYRM